MTTVGASLASPSTWSSRCKSAETIGFDAQTSYTESALCKLLHSNFDHKKSTPRSSVKGSGKSKVMSRF